MHKLILYKNDISNMAIISQSIILNYLPTLSLPISIKTVQLDWLVMYIIFD